MSNNNIVIREIKPEDNTQIEAVIRGCFHEFGLPLVGTAYADKETPKMFESYQNENAIYFVVEDNGKVIGGGGVKPLKDYEGSVCEIQKMYSAPEMRGNGYGKLLFIKCLEAAKKLGYKQCYLESASQLKAAIHIYESFDFKHLKAPMGNTGHFSCGVWMIREL